MLSATKGFRFASAAGFAVILLSIVLIFFYTPKAATLIPGFNTPILSLEFSASFSDANQLFGDDRALIQRYHTGHHIDMLFLIIYGAFLGFANLGAWYVQRRALSLIGMIAAGVAASADFAENLQLMQLTHALLGTGSVPDFWLLRLFVSTKFIMINVATLCLLPLMWQQARLGKLFVIATLIQAPATLLTLSGQYQFSDVMGLSTMVAWLCLLGWALRQRNDDESGHSGVGVNVQHHC